MARHQLPQATCCGGAVYDYSDYDAVKALTQFGATQSHRDIIGTSGRSGSVRPFRKDSEGRLPRCVRYLLRHKPM